MNISYIKKFIKTKISKKKESEIIYVRAFFHLIRYFLFYKYRKNRCIIDPSCEFFYKYKYLKNYFSFPLSLFSRYLKKKKIFISINNCCNYSVGHIYSEIDLLKRIWFLEDKYSFSTIWFTTSRKEILGETKEFFKNKNFKILIGGIKRILLTFVAMHDPSISINGSIGHSNYLLGKKNSNRMTFQNIRKRHANYISRSSDFYPNKENLVNYNEEKNKLMKELKITRKYIVIQIKTMSVNSTFEPLKPELLLKSIEYFQNKNYQVVFAGREKFPDTFLNKSIIDYSNSKYASSLNDLLIVSNCSLVISSSSGFCFLPENLDKPLLMYNTTGGAGNYGRRTIFLPTLLSRKLKTFNARIQHKYLCTYGTSFGRDVYDDLYILHIPTSEEIFMAAKELEGMLSDNVPPFTSLQKKIRDQDGCPLLSDGLSRISDNYLSNHEYFFRN